MPLDPQELADARCNVAATLAVVGEKWSLKILRNCFFGLRRYSELLAATGCARNILSDRLAKLVENQLLDRRAYREEGQRERAEYRLTERARDLYPVLVALMQWGDRWLSGNEAAPVLLSHRDCGAQVRVVLCCGAGHGPLSEREVEARPGTGVRRQTASTGA